MQGIPSWEHQWSETALWDKTAWKTQMWTPKWYQQLTPSCRCYNGQPCSCASWWPALLLWLSCSCSSCWLRAAHKTDLGNYCKLWFGTETSQWEYLLRFSEIFRWTCQNLKNMWRGIPVQNTKTLSCSPQELTQPKVFPRCSLSDSMNQRFTITLYFLLKQLKNSTCFPLSFCLFPRSLSFYVPFFS